MTAILIIGAIVALLVMVGCVSWLLFREPPDADYL